MTDSPDEAPSGEEFFHLLLDHLCVAGFDGYWKRLNPAWTRTLGWTVEELLARPLIEFVHPDDRERTLTARSELKEGEPLLSFTNRYLHEDGSFRWFEWRSVADPARELVFAVARDVTETHENRLALRALTESLETTFASIADGLIVTDGDGRITRVNPIAEHLTGWPAAEALGRPVGEVLRIVSVSEPTRPPAPIERTLEEGMRFESRDQRLLLARDDTTFPIAVSRAPMTDGSGALSGAVFVFRDLTAEKEAQQERDRLRRQLVHADRMASVGTLAAGVAHEINNPLAYVIANLDMIAGDLRGLSDVTFSAHIADCVEMAVEARQGAERIRKIVRELRTFSRAEEEHRAPTDLRPVLDLSIDMAFNEIRHRARLVKDYAPTPHVETDDSRLGQVFVNLLVNAAQAIPEGDTEANEIRIRTRTDADGNAVVEISDTGSGIAPEVLDRIFDPFFTTKPVGVGTGLGLAICHNILEGMGGTITATNRPEGGARFQITLPAAPTAEVEARSQPKERLDGPQRRARVLIVDDERSVGATLVRAFRAHDATAVSSAREALALIEGGATYDVVFSDLMMPQMSGMEFFEVLRSRHPRLAERVVFMTGGAFTDAARRFLETIPNERIDKPFDIDVVRRTLQRVATADERTTE